MTGLRFVQLTRGLRRVRWKICQPERAILPGKPGRIAWQKAKMSDGDTAGQTGAVRVACPGEVVDIPLEDDAIPPSLGEAADDDEERFQPEPRRDLRAETTSLRHLLLYERKQRLRGLQGSGGAEEPDRRHNIEPFGDLITGDHENANAMIRSGLSRPARPLAAS